MDMKTGIDYSVLAQAPFYLNDSETDWVRKTLENMDADEKIGQIICAEIRAGDVRGIEKITDRYHLGAVMCLPSPMEAAYQLIAELQDRSDTPMLIGGNLEEGADAVGGTNIANNLQIGATQDARLAGAMGSITGQEGTAVGMNWAFAPVIDIGMNWRNPVIATRVFGRDPAFVAEAGFAFVEGMQSHGMAAAIKHFPGDGVDERDQHFSPSVNTLSCEQWDDTFGMAYRKCIEAGALSVMVGHIMQPAWSKAINPDLTDEDILPASTSRELLQGLLREHLGFNGMISTDATTMTAFDQLLPRWKALPAAIEAGCDMILFTEDMDEDIAFMREALASGRLSQKRLDEAVMRVLGVKAALKLPQKKAEKTLQSPLAAAKSVIGRTDFRNAEKECAGRAVTLVKDTTGLLPISPEKHRRICLYTYAEGRGYGSKAAEVAETVREKLENCGFEVTLMTPGAAYDSYNSFKNKFDLILYAVNMTSTSNNTVCRLNWAPSMGKDAPNYITEVPTIFISFGNPYHLADVPRVRTYINAYKFKESTVNAVIERLLGLLPFTGVNPVDPFCGFWDTRL